MITLGLDLSLVGTGYVLLENGKIKKQKLIRSKPSGKEPIRELERLMEIRSQITLPKTDLAVIEGIAFMARNSVSLVQLSALNYMVREHLYIHKIPFIIVAPTTLKKFVTSKGNCPKDLMMLETYKRFGESFTDNNICDAYGLSKVGEAVLGGGKKLTKQQEEVVKILSKQIK